VKEPRGRPAQCGADGGRGYRPGARLRPRGAAGGGIAGQAAWQGILDDETDTAYHEAAHAVVGYLTRCGIRSITIEPRGDTKGLHVGNRLPIRYRPDIERTGRMRTLMEARVMTALAGGLAILHWSGRDVMSEHESAGQDCDDVVGLVSDWCSSAEEADAYVAWLRVRTVDLLRIPAHWQAVKRLAEVLRQERTIYTRRARQIIRTALAGE